MSLVDTRTKGSDMPLLSIGTKLRPLSTCGVEPETLMVLLSAVHWTATEASTELMESWMRHLGGACERGAEEGLAEATAAPERRDSDPRRPAPPPA